jgi:hypothetical protein
MVFLLTLIRVLILGNLSRLVLKKVFMPMWISIREMETIMMKNIYWMKNCIRKDIALKEPMLGWIVSGLY